MTTDLLKRAEEAMQAYLNSLIPGEDTFYVNNNMAAVIQELYDALKAEQEELEMWRNVGRVNSRNADLERMGLKKKKEG